MDERDEVTSADARFDLTREDCWVRALQAFGTAHIFELRARKYSRLLRWVAFVGLVVPLVVGGFALSYGASFVALPVLIIIGSAVGIAQATISLWSLVARWLESYAYAIESVISNKSLYLRFRDLGGNPPASHADLISQYRLLQVEDDARRDQDYKQEVTEPEKRRAMRAGLRELGRACASCKKIPTDMNPTKCGVCGDF
jgi:mobilome CxxCx(11)CxxC protein